MWTLKICATGAFLLLSPVNGESGDLCAPSPPRAVVVNNGETLTLKTRCSSNWVSGTNSYRLCSDRHHDVSFTAADFPANSGWTSSNYGWVKTGLSLEACKDFCENDLRGCTAVKSNGNMCFVLKNVEEEAACAGTTDNNIESYYDTASAFELTSLDIKAGGKVLAQGENPVRVVVSGTVNIDGIFNVSSPRGNNAGNDEPSAGGGAGGGALLINSLQSITVNGQVLADGGYGGDAGGPSQSFFSNGEGSDGKGGIGVAGGWNGGDGTGSGQNGMPGFGPGASGAGPTDGGVPPGAGGAGYATQGGNGFCQYTGMCPQVPGGPAYGNGALSGGLFGGSGAGSGGNDGDNEEGAGGGGSGGTIWLSSPSITIGAGATVSAMGGLGGLDDYHHNPGNNRNGANNGGPGSAGRIRIDALNEYSIAGVIPEPHKTMDLFTPFLDPSLAGACFHGGGTVLLESGSPKHFSELSLGDRIKTSDGQGGFSFSPVLVLPHKNNSEPAAFLTLTTETGKAVDMTSDHFIPKCNQEEVTAGVLVVGDCILTVDGKETLMGISSTAKTGVYTAITQGSFIVVNGVVASSFSKDSDPTKPEHDYKKYQLELEVKRNRKLAHRENKLGKRLRAVAELLSDTQRAE